MGSDDVVFLYDLVAGQKLMYDISGMIHLLKQVSLLCDTDFHLRAARRRAIMCAQWLLVQMENTSLLDQRIKWSE